jgi:hypothetical protein
MGKKFRGCIANVIHMGFPENWKVQASGKNIWIDSFI